MSIQQVEATLEAYFKELLDEAPLESLEPPPSVSSQIERNTAPAVAPTSLLTPTALSSTTKPYVDTEKQRDIAAKITTTVNPTSVTPAREQLSDHRDHGIQPAVTGYDQHKDRLEKMLKQVSLLNNPESADCPSSTESTSLEQLQLPSVVGETPIIVESDLTVNEQYQVMPPLSSEWLENGRPHWAQERFEILLIEVNGLQLAVPLIALGQIQMMEEGSLTPLFGQSEWFMGLQKTPSGNVKTVDTAKFVMPERYKSDHDYKYVVSINGLAWGLAVDRIHQPISVQPDAIRWRTKRTNRPWMAGTLKDHMCVLLDIPSMGEILQGEDKSRRKNI
jgi:purine-binding chemotaxis protein CheW